MYVSIPASSKPSMYVSSFVDHMMLKIPLQCMAFPNQCAPAPCCRCFFLFIIHLFTNFSKFIYDIWQVCKKDRKHWTQPLSERSSENYSNPFSKLYSTPHKCKGKARLHLKIKELTLETEKMLNSLKNKLPEAIQKE